MSAPSIYLHLPGVARDALEFYQSTFGGTITLHTYADFGRTDGPPTDIAHGELAGPVSLFAADASGDEDALDAKGISLTLLGTADPATLTAWFHTLAASGRVISDLQARHWGDTDGQVRDQFGVRWLIGFTGTA